MSTSCQHLDTRKDILMMDQFDSQQVASPHPDALSPDLPATEDPPKTDTATSSPDLAKELTLTPVMKQGLLGKSIFNKTRRRKSAVPAKAIPRKGDRVPGIRMRFELAKIAVTRKPNEYQSFGWSQKSQIRVARLLEGFSPELKSLMLKRKRRLPPGATALHVSGQSFTQLDLQQQQRKRNDSELFLANEEYDAEYYDRRLRRKRKRTNYEEEEESEAEEEEAAEEEEQAESYEGEEDLIDYYTPPATPLPGKKKKAVRKPRVNKPRHSGEKVCCSCQTTQTPIWREVKDHWGEGWEDVLLCNACGLQWRMCGLRCIDCLYVPRASEKRSKKCTRCENGKWYRKS